MAQNITLLGASYTAVPAVTLPKTGGGTAKFSDASVTTAVESDVAEGKTFILADGSIGTGRASGGSGTPAISVVDTLDSHGGTIREITALDISDTTAEASDVAQGKYFYTAAGVKTAGMASGGGTPSATQHTILFEFEDTTTTSITAYWDGTFISDAIRSTTPTEYGGKTVNSASLDGTAWYTKPSEDWDVLFDDSVTFQTSSPYNNIWIASLGNLQPAVGEVYRVTVDGTVYNLTTHEDDGRIYIGNPKYDWGTDDGSAPFCFFNGGYGGLQGGTELSATSHTLKIEKQVST